jgi:hypothetical protein
LRSERRLLPEKDYMSCPKWADRTPKGDIKGREVVMEAMNTQATVTEREGTDWDLAFSGLLADLTIPLGAQEAERSLRCVSSGYLAEGCSCGETIPYHVVTTAWTRALSRGHAEGFFRFPWQEQVWLAYGLYDGHVRGVYCPAHSAERARRASETAAVPLSA